ncbi:hypothetical protein D3C81_1211720 [compost metagenome]
MIAAGHAMDVHRAGIARHFQRGIQLQAVIGGVECAGFFDQCTHLLEHQAATGLLAHFHAAAAQGTPGLVDGVTGHRLAHFVAGFRCTALVLFEGRLHPALVSHLHLGAELGGQVAVEVGQEVEARGVVVRAFGKDRVATDVLPTRWQGLLAHGDSWGQGDQVLKLYLYVMLIRTRSSVRTRPFLLSETAAGVHLPAVARHLAHTRISQMSGQNSSAISHLLQPNLCCKATSCAVRPMSLRCGLSRQAAGPRRLRRRYYE